MLVLNLQLEEFRKKKAAAKKSATTNSTHSANGDLKDTKPPVSDSVPVITDTTPDLGSGFHAAKNENKTINAVEAESDVKPISSFNIPSASPGPTYSTDGKLDNKAAPYKVDPEKDKAVNHPAENIYSSYSHFRNIKQEDSRDVKDIISSASSVTTQVLVNKSSPERSRGSSFANNLSYSDHQPANDTTYRGNNLFTF